MEKMTLTQIEDALAKSGIPITKLLAHSGVSAGSYYRERRGEGNMRAATHYKLVRALAEIK